MCETTWLHRLTPAVLPAVAVAMLVVALALVWGWPGWSGCGVVVAVLAANAALGVWAPWVKARVSRLVQGRVINPVMFGLVRIGLNPLGLIVLETTGRRSGRARAVLVSGRVVDGVLWVVAEHGARAAYVRNLQANPHVRVRLRHGVTGRWVAGAAFLDEADDAARRLRWIAGWNPLRVYSALLVGFFGSDLATVRIDLQP